MPRFSVREFLARLLVAGRLAGLMILGATAGYLAAPFALVAIEGYDHGHETEEYALYMIPAGAIAGLVVHLCVGSDTVWRKPPGEAPKK